MLRCAVTMLQPAISLAQGFLDQHIRKRRNLRGSLSEGRDLKHIAQHNAHVFAPLESRQEQRNVRFKRPRAETRQALMEFCRRNGAVWISTGQERLKSL